MIEELAKTGFEAFYAGSNLGWKWEDQIEKTQEHWRMVIGEVLRKREELTTEYTTNRDEVYQYYRAHGHSISHSASKADQWRAEDTWRRVKEMQDG